LEIRTESATELDVFEAVYGVVEETSQGDDANSKTSRFHSTWLDDGDDGDDGDDIRRTRIATQ
jgi:hypothetical protein